MLKENKLVIGLTVVIVASLFLSFSDVQISPRLQKKIDTAIAATYEVETFVLQHISVPTILNDVTPAKLDGTNLFEIHSETKLVGYLYLGEAASMKRMFDYIILFNIDFTIKKSKVLIYREDYGQQIGSQRWLKQFIGLSTDDSLIYGENIDAISGATISASSMTKATDNVLKSIHILKEKELLNY